MILFGNRLSTASSNSWGRFVAPQIIAIQYLHHKQEASSPYNIIPSMIQWVLFSIETSVYRQKPIRPHPLPHPSPSIPISLLSSFSTLTDNLEWPHYPITYSLDTTHFFPSLATLTTFNSLPYESSRSIGRMTMESTVWGKSHLWRVSYPHY